MCALSTTTSTDIWATFAWVITPGHSASVVDIPPPRAADVLVDDTPPPEMPGTDGPGLLETEDHLDFLEDLLEAQEAEAIYEAQGLRDTILYTDYRNKRLGSESSI